ncbi:ERF family protein [Streptomyces noursei]
MTTRLRPPRAARQPRSLRTATTRLRRPTPPPEPAPTGKPPKIHKAIAAVIRDMPPIPKNGRNEDDDYTYATYADIVTTVRTTAARHGVTWAPVGVNMRQERRGDVVASLAHMRFKITGPRGDHEIVEFCAEGADSSDKGPVKAEQACLKYMLIQVFALAPEDVFPEGDATSPGRRRKPTPEDVNDERLIAAATAPTVAHVRAIYDHAESAGATPRELKLLASIGETKPGTAAPTPTEAPAPTTPTPAPAAHPAPPKAIPTQRRSPAPPGPRQDNKKRRNQAIKELHQAAFASGLTAPHEVAEAFRAQYNTGLADATLDQLAQATADFQARIPGPQQQPTAPAVPPTPAPEPTPEQQARAMAVADLFEAGRISGYATPHDTADAFHAKHGMPLEDAPLDLLHCFTAGLLPRE